MAVMDERIPGMIQEKPQTLGIADLLKILAGAHAGTQPQGLPQGAGEAGAVGPSGAIALPARVGTAPPQLAMPPPAPGMPGPGGASVMPGPLPAMQHPAMQTGFSFPTKAARNGAVVAGAMQSIGQVVAGYKQKKYSEQVQGAKGIMEQYLQQKMDADQIQDPQAKARALAAADQLLQGKEAQKFLAKAQDPTSPAYTGVQLAYRDTQGRIAAMQKSEDQAVRAQAAWQAAQARMEAVQAREREIAAQEETKRERTAAQEREVKLRADSNERIAKERADTQVSIWKERVEQMKANRGATQQRFVANLNMRAKELGQKRSDLYAREGLKIYEPAFAANDEAAKANLMHARLQSDPTDQAAAYALAVSFVKSTVSTAKGSRITKVEWEQAIGSRPAMAGLGARFDKDGYLQGVVLTPEQQGNMLNEIQIQRKNTWQGADARARYAGITDRPDSNAPGLDPVPAAQGGATPQRTAASGGGSTATPKRKVYNPRTNKVEEQ